MLSVVVAITLRCIFIVTQYVILLLMLVDVLPNVVMLSVVLLNAVTTECNNRYYIQWKTVKTIIQKKNYYIMACSHATPIHSEKQRNKTSWQKVASLIGLEQEGQVYRTFPYIRDSLVRTRRSSVHRSQWLRH